jgi:hypothetical protein
MNVEGILCVRVMFLPPSIVINNLDDDHRSRRRSYILTQSTASQHHIHKQQQAYGPVSLHVTATLTRAKDLPGNLTTKLYTRVKLALNSRGETQGCLAQAANPPLCWYVSALELPRTRTVATGARATHANFLPSSFLPFASSFCCFWYRGGGTGGEVVATSRREARWFMIRFLKRVVLVTFVVVVQEIGGSIQGSSGGSFCNIQLSRGIVETSHILK